MDSLISTVAKVAKVNVRCDDDIVDRLHHRYSVLFLVIFTVLVSTTQYVGNPIHCWCPAYFTSNHEEFTDKICWITNTYYLPDEAVPGRAGNEKIRIGYYQWVPMVLLCQAFLFYLPVVFWRVFGDRSGININNLVEAAETIQNALYPERRDKTIKYMVRHIDHYLDYQREYRGGCCVTFKHFIARHLCLICGNRYGNYLVGLFMFTKILFFFNIIVQLFILNGFLGTDYHAYGIDLIRDVLRGESWTPSSRFPRITLCDFTIKQMGTQHNHVVQCVLPINLFNEKIYMFLWFWFVILALVTFFQFFHWLWIIGFSYSRIKYVRKHLKVMDKLNEDNDRDRKLAQKFAELYLRQDGIFVLKLVAKNSTDLVVADIVANLWDNYKNKTSNTSDGELEPEDSGSVP